MSLTDDEREPQEFNEVANNDFERLKNKLTKLNYADGVAEGRDSVFQKGFDEGYKDGFLTAFEIEKFRHLFKNLNEEKVNDQLLQEKKEFEKLQMKDINSPSHFQYTLHKNERLNIISQKQQDYVEHTLAELRQKLPQSSVLLEAQPNGQNL